jgi:sn-glycerol 3-phosphate transport system substrate-binding protein
MNAKQTRKRIAAVGAAVCACILTFTGCASAGAAGAGGKAASSVDLSKGPEVDLTFWHSMGGTNGAALQTMVADFNKAHEGHIKVTAQYQGTYDDGINKFKSAMVAKNGPDLIQVYEIGTRYMIDSGFVDPMQKYIDMDKWNIKQLEPNIAAYYTIDHKLYSMPLNSSAPLLYYNKKIFSEAGLDAANPPKTFDQIVADAPKLTKKDAGGKLTQAALGMYFDGWFFEESLWKSGLAMYNNGNGRVKSPTKAVYDGNGGGLKFFTMYNNLIKTGTMPAYAATSDDAKSAFVNGKLAMYIDSTAALKGLLLAINGGFELGTGNYPALSDATVNGGISIGGASIWMTKNTDARAQQAKWEFVKFMVSAKEQVFWNTQTGYFPVTTAAHSEQAFKDNIQKYPQFTTAISELHASSAKSVGALCPVQTQARKIETTEAQKMVNGQQTPEEALKAIVSQVNSALSDYNEANGK